MTESDHLPYLPTMFATCMLFQATFVLCVVLWVFFPDLPGHSILTTMFPQFKLLDVPNFAYGLIMSAVYGWFVSAVFVFFYNLWSSIARIIWGRTAVS